MSYLEFLKRSKNHIDTRWVVKYNKKGLVKEVKQIYKPSEYYAMNLHNKGALIKILENDKKTKNPILNE